MKAGRKFVCVEDIYARALTYLEINSTLDLARFIHGFERVTTMYTI
jgi:hypothetical protein